MARRAAEAEAIDGAGRVIAGMEVVSVRPMPPLRAVRPWSPAPQT